MKPTFSKKILLLMVTAIIYLSGMNISLWAELPELLPKELFFGGSLFPNYKVSPDGKLMAYTALSEKGIPNIRIKTIGQEDGKMVSSDDKIGITDYSWAYTNRHLLFLRDIDGDENFHVFAVDIETKTTTDLTPFSGAKAQNLLLNPKHPGKILVGLNVRDKRVFDMYRIDIQTKEAVKEVDNPGDVRWWLADRDFVVRAAVAINPGDSSTTLRIRDAADKPWRTLIHWPFGETGLLEGYGSEMALAFTPDGKAIYVQAAFSGDYTQVAKVDVKTGKVLKILAEEPNASIWNTMGPTLYDEAMVVFHPVTAEIQMAAFNYLKPYWRVYDPALKEDIDILNKVGSGIFLLKNRDLNDRYWNVVYFSDTNLGAEYLYDRQSKKVELLFDTSEIMAKYNFSPMQVHVIKARDGSDIPCYLTLPSGVSSEKLPMVVAPHGGPWVRDDWGYDGFSQFFANRGYAVLKVNFRGSAGLGKKFLNAGIGQWGVGSMQHDITDAVKWFIDKGIADPKRIGIFGGSYGGYATLAGLTFTPDLYACGVDMFGPSNVRTNIEAMPDWWGPIKVRWLRRIGGDVLKDDAYNQRISPFYHANNIKAKLLLLHGLNDPRVKISESEKIVSEMRKNNKEVIFVVYPDEGHGIGRFPNILDSLGRIEEFLANNLGGRAEPRKEVQGSSAQLK